MLGNELELTVEGLAAVRDPSPAFIDAAVRSLTARGGPAFAILDRRGGDYVQCAGGDGVFTVEWRERGAPSLRHWVAGKSPRALEAMVAIPTNGAQVTVRASERLSTDDVLRIFSAFVDGRVRPVAFAWRDITERFLAATTDSDDVAHDPEMRKPSIVTDAFRARLARLLEPAGFAARAKGASFVRKQGKNTHRIRLSSSHYNSPGRVSCFIDFTFEDSAVRKRVPNWSAGGKLDLSGFGEAPSNIAVRGEASALLSLVSTTTAFFDFMENPRTVLQQVSRRYVPGVDRPAVVVPYLAVHLGGAGISEYAAALLAGRPELWPAFLGARELGEGDDTNLHLREDGAALALSMARVGLDVALSAPRDAVVSRETLGAHGRAFFGLLLRAWGEPDAAAGLRRVDDARIVALGVARDALRNKTVDSLDAASLVLHAATRERRRPRRSAPKPRFFQHTVLHEPFAPKSNSVEVSLAPPRE
jgi:hypothetical protein